MMNIAFDSNGPYVVSVNVSDTQRPTIQSYTIRQATELRDNLNAAISAAHDAAEAEKEANRERFCLELGVNLNGERVCALEAGPFETSEDAVKYAFAVRERKTIDVAELPDTDWHDLIPGDADDLPIVGATLNIFTDADGTIRNLHLY